MRLASVSLQIGMLRNEADERFFAKRNVNGMLPDQCDGARHTSVGRCRNV